MTITKTDKCFHKLPLKINYPSLPAKNESTTFRHVQLQWTRFQLPNIQVHLSHLFFHYLAGSTDVATFLTVFSFLCSLKSLRVVGHQKSGFLLMHRLLFNSVKMLQMSERTSPTSTNSATRCPFSPWNSLHFSGHHG